MHVYSPVPAPRADLPLPPAQLPCAAAADGGIVLPISDAEWSNALLLAKRSAELGLRSEIVRPDAGSLGARIRQSRLVPYQAIIGAKEAAEDQVAVRLRDGRRLDPAPANDVLARIGALVDARSVELWDDQDLRAVL